jgi:hypothetical protein
LRQHRPTSTNSAIDQPHQKNTLRPTIIPKSQQLLKGRLSEIRVHYKEQSHRLPKHRNQKYDYEDFFRLLIYYFTSGTTSLKLLVQTRLNADLPAPELGLRPVPYSTCQDAFERFSPRLFQAVFQHLLSNVSFKAVPECYVPRYIREDVSS